MLVIKPCSFWQFFIGCEIGLVDAIKGRLVEVITHCTPTPPPGIYLDLYQS